MTVTDPSFPTLCLFGAVGESTPLHAQADSFLTSLQCQTEEDADFLGLLLEQVSLVLPSTAVVPAESPDRGDSSLAHTVPPLVSHQQVMPTAACPLTPDSVPATPFGATVPEGRIAASVARHARFHDISLGVEPIASRGCVATVDAPISPAARMLPAVSHSLSHGSSLDAVTLPQPTSPVETNTDSAQQAVPGRSMATLPVPSSRAEMETPGGSASAGQPNDPNWSASRTVTSAAVVSPRIPMFEPARVAPWTSSPWISPCEVTTQPSNPGLRVADHPGAASAGQALPVRVAEVAAFTLESNIADSSTVPVRDFIQPAAIVSARGEAPPPDRDDDISPGVIDSTLAAAHSLKSSAPGIIAHKAGPPAPPPLIDQIHSHVREHLEELQHSGRMDVHMDLQPPQLGRLQLHLALEDGNLNVRFVVQDDAVKRLLDQQLEPLRVRFAEIGVALGEFDVSRDTGSSEHNPPPAFEPPAYAPTRDHPELNRQRQSYSAAMPPPGLVDVIA